MPLIDIQFKGIKELVHDLKVAHKKAIPYAVRDALNTTAFEARKVWSAQIKKTFQTRNTYTAGRALEVVKAQGTNLSTMQATLGSTAAYMAEREKGGTSRGKSGKRGIPGPSAAGQKAGGTRTRPVRMSNRLRAITAAKATRGGSREQRNAIALAIARKTGKKHVVLERPKGGKGIFFLQGSKKKPRTRLVWDVSRSSFHVKPHPTLGPTLKFMRPKMEHIFLASVLKQLRFHRIGI